MKCQNCHFELTGQEKVCPNCYAKISPPAGPYGQMPPPPYAQSPYAPPQPPVPPYYNQPYAQPKKKGGFAIASLVLGIISVLQGFSMDYFFDGSLILSILAIIFGALGIKTARKGMAIAGLILGIISASFIILGIVLGYAFGGYDLWYGEFNV